MMLNCLSLLVIGLGSVWLRIDVVLMIVRIKDEVDLNFWDIEYVVIYVGGISIV